MGAVKVGDTCLKSRSSPEMTNERLLFKLLQGMMSTWASRYSGRRLSPFSSKARLLKNNLLNCKVYRQDSWIDSSMHKLYVPPRIASQPL